MRVSFPLVSLFPSSLRLCLFAPRGRNISVQDDALGGLRSRIVILESRLIHLMTLPPVDATEPLGDPSPGTTATMPDVSAQSVFRQVHWRWRDVFIALAPLVLLRTAVAVIDTALVPLAPSSLWAPLAVLVVAWAWILVFTLAITRRRIVEWPRLPRRRVVFVEALWALLAIAVIAVAEIVFSVFATALFGDRSMANMSLGRIAPPPSRLEWMAFAILAVLAAPVAEEIFFRGMLYNALRQRLPVAAAAPLQAIVFGLLHPFDPVSMAQVALIGLGLALVYEWRQTLLTPIIMHGLRNVGGVTLMALMMAAAAAAPRLGGLWRASRTGVLDRRGGARQRCRSNGLAGWRRDQERGRIPGRGHAQSARIHPEQTDGSNHHDRIHTGTKGRASRGGVEEAKRPMKGEAL